MVDRERQSGHAVSRGARGGPAAAGVTAASGGAPPARGVVRWARLPVSLPGAVLLALVGVEAVVDRVLSGALWPALLAGVAAVLWAGLAFVLLVGSSGYDGGSGERRRSLWLRRLPVVVALGPWVVLVAGSVATLSESGQASALGGARAPLLLVLLIAHLVAWARLGSSVDGAGGSAEPGWSSADGWLGGSAVARDLCGLRWFVVWAARAPALTAWAWFVTLLVPAAALLVRSAVADDDAAWRVVAWLMAGSVWLAVGGLVQVSGLQQLEHLGRLRDARRAAGGRGSRGLVLLPLLVVHALALAAVPGLTAWGAWELARSAWLTGLVAVTGAVLASAVVAWVTRALWLQVRAEVVARESAAAEGGVGWRAGGVAVRPGGGEP